MKQTIPTWIKIFILNDRIANSEKSNEKISEDVEKEFQIESRTDIKIYNFLEGFKEVKVNKYLIFSLLDLIFIELFPELVDYSSEHLKQ